MKRSLSPLASGSVQGLKKRPTTRGAMRVANENSRRCRSFSPWVYEMIVKLALGVSFRFAVPYNCCKLRGSALVLDCSKFE